ncbi:MAG: hypothetical protein Q8M07_23205 [Prosthecobacter sp.]|nr:hypothetical protein [Prosthecobacter sp.]
MTSQRLHDLLYDCAELSADRRASEILDTLVTTTLVDEDSFWDAPVEERIMYGLFSALYHAGANGLDDMWSINEMASVETLASALEGLQLIGEKALYSHALVFWNHMISPAVKLGLEIPEKYSDTKRGDYGSVENAIIESDLDTRLPENIQEASDSFVSCWNTGFPDSILSWVRTFENQLAARICKD